MSQSQIKELKDKVATGCRILFSVDLLRFNGHVTARVPGQDAFLYGFNRHTFGKTKPEDILMVDLDGNKLSGKHRTGVELPIYTNMFKSRKDVNAVIHCHLPFAITFGVTRKEILQVSGSNVGTENVAVLDDASLIANDQMGRKMVKAIGKGSILQLRGHGQVLVGKSVEEAVFKVIDFEHNARMNYIIQQFASGKIDPIKRKIGMDEAYKMHSRRIGATRPLGVSPRWTWYAKVADEVLSGKRDPELSLTV
ncbi:MAG: class II aldolase/adducin family protein [Nitrososphaerales archaeon]